jgi:hypothetical protein
MSGPSFSEREKTIADLFARELTPHSYFSKSPSFAIPSPYEETQVLFAEEMEVRERERATMRTTPTFTALVDGSIQSLLSYNGGAVGEFDPPIFWIVQ